MGIRSYSSAEKWVVERNLILRPVALIMVYVA